VNRIVLSGLIVTPEKVLRGSLCVEDRLIAAVTEADGLPGWESGTFRRLDLSGLLVFPGLVDIHVHGALGRDFIEGPEALQTAAADFARDGVSSFAASLTVLGHLELCALLQAYAVCEPPADGARFLGLHSEGPFISPRFKALMDQRYICPPDTGQFREMVEAAVPPGASSSRLVLMTFSPHYKGSLDLLDAAHEAGVRMMIGHSEADAEETVRALDRGADGYTHLYNAMSGHHHRDEGVLTAAFTDGRGRAELIADTVHVRPRSLRIAYALLRSRRLILVSDAMPGKSMDDGAFVFSGLDCVKKDGKAFVRATGRLAGSVVPLNHALRNMSEICGAAPLELAEMGSANPSKLLGLYDSQGSLEAGKRADIAVFTPDYDCVLTIVDGKIVYEV
jgi:N-acetylglucosamine-6-phosphate deacetylase